MFVQKDRKKIRSILENIYKTLLSKEDIDLLKNQIVQLIENFNKRNPKKKIKISEKTSLIICYGDNVYSNNSNSIKVFQKFFKNNLKKLFNTIHFLPF